VAAPQPVDTPVVLREFGVTSPVTRFQMGKPYRFSVTNEGSVAHEFMVLPRRSLDHMAALFEITERELGPGQRAAREFTFQREGDYEFACHLPGHYEAGMVFPITVDR
jgi:uncharacterized cupredoxin-like copper-binding protein